MSRKSMKRPMPWLLSCAKAATTRSRSPGVRLFAFLRIRTIRVVEPTRVVPRRASILTSPFVVLGLPNLPATKKRTDEPLIGTVKAILLEKTPVFPRRNTIAPDVAAETLVSCKLTVGVVTPEGFVTRIRQGEGAHVTKRASALELLFIYISMSMRHSYPICKTVLFSAIFSAERRTQGLYLL